MFSDSQSISVIYAPALEEKEENSNNVDNSAKMRARRAEEKCVKQYKAALVENIQFFYNIATREPSKK